MFVFKFGFLLVVSVAAFAATQININSSRKPKSSYKSSENDDELSFQQEQSEDREKDKFEDSNPETEQEEEEIKSTRSQTKQDLRSNEPENHDVIKCKFPKINVNEIDMLKNVVNEMEQRRVTLEVKLLELYGLKEQKLYISQQKNQLKVKMREIEVLNLSLNALNSEREKLHQEIKQNELAKRELEIAKRAIWEIHEKTRVDEEKVKGQLGMIKEQVLGFQVEEKENGNGDFKVEKRIREMKNLELEVLKMKRRNKEAQLEKRDLAIKLDATEARIHVLSNLTESKLIADMQGEISSFTQANKKLTKQAETLQKDRFSMVEELVYQRRLNTVMRIEVQDYNTPPENKSKARITNDAISDSLEKFRLLNSDYSFASVSSPESSSESDKITGTTIDSSCSTQKSTKKKFSLFRKIKRWGRSKDDLSAISSTSGTTRKGLVRRFSESMAPTNMPFRREKLHDSTVTSFKRQKEQDPIVTSLKREKVQYPTVTSFMSERVHDENTESTLPRVRRVSFHELLTSEERIENDEVKSAKGSEETLVMDRDNEANAELDKKEDEFLSSSVKVDLVTFDDSRKSEIKTIEIERAEELPSGVSDVPLHENKVEGQMRNLIVAVLLFFLLMLLAYFKGLPGGVH